MTQKEKEALIFGIVPAAGVSRRMGIAKQTLPFGKSTVTGGVVRTMLDTDICAIAVVTRTDLLNALDLPGNDRVRIVINDDPTTQMLDSIRLGLAHLNSSHPDDPDDPDHLAGSGVLVIPGDMPTVPASACRACIHSFRADTTRIVVATHGGKGGHPVIFPASLCPALDQIEGGLNHLMLRHENRVVQVEVNDPGVLRDIDTPADYDNLQPR